MVHIKNEDRNLLIIVLNITFKPVEYLWLTLHESCHWPVLLTGEHRSLPKQASGPDLE